MTKITAIATLVSVASTQAAINQIDIKARVAGTTEWRDTIDYTASDGTPLNLEVGVWYSWNNGVSFSGSTHNIITSGWNAAAGDSVILVDRADSAQHPDGRQGNYNFGGQTQGQYITATTARISAAGNPDNTPSGGISIKQDTPDRLGSSLDTTNPAFGYRFNLLIARDDFDAATIRHLLIDAPLAGVNSYRSYASLSTKAVNENLDALLPTDGVTINANWVPAPASMALLGLGGLFIGRRRQ